MVDPVSLVLEHLAGVCRVSGGWWRVARHPTTASPACRSRSDVAENIGRRCLGIELDPRYAQAAIERWQAFTGREARRA